MPPSLPIRADRLARQSLIASQRPWVGVITNGVVATSPIHAGLGKDEIAIDLSVAVRNYGPSPALHVIGMPTLNIAQAENIKDFLSEMKMNERIACDIADGEVVPQQSPTLVNGKMEMITAPAEGQTIFPTDTVRFTFHEDRLGYAGIKDWDQQPLKIFGCVAYTDQFATEKPTTIHHTRFCYLTAKVIRDFSPSDGLTPCITGQDAD